jgi:hypothetical protein
VRKQPLPPRGRGLGPRASALAEVQRGHPAAGPFRRLCEHGTDLSVALSLPGEVGPQVGVARPLIRNRDGVVVLRRTPPQGEVTVGVGSEEVSNSVEREGEHGIAFRRWDTVAGERGTP